MPAQELKETETRSEQQLWGETWPSCEKERERAPCAPSLRCGVPEPTPQTARSRSSSGNSRKKTKPGLGSCAGVGRPRGFRTPSRTSLLEQEGGSGLENQQGPCPGAHGADTSVPCTRGLGPPDPLGSGAHVPTWSMHEATVGPQGDDPGIAVSVHHCVHGSFRTTDAVLRLCQPTNARPCLSFPVKRSPGFQVTASVL